MGAIHSAGGDKLRRDFVFYRGGIMAGFCIHCGSSIDGAFCSKCGKPAPSSTAARPAQAAPVQVASVQPVAVPLAPASKGPSVAKILLIVLGVIALLVVIAIGGAIFAFRTIKHKVQEATNGAVGSTSQVNVSHGNACRLLSADQVKAVLDVEIVRTQEMLEGSNAGCAYYTNADGFAHLQKVAAAQAKRDSETASKEIDPNSKNPMEIMKHTKEMEGMIKSQGLTQPGDEGRVFAFTIQKHFGSENWSSMRTAMAMVPGFEEVPDVGDQAMVGTFGHTVMIRKGNSMIRLETTYVPEARTRGAELGRQIVSGL
jgi:hypothetical protein